MSCEVLDSKIERTSLQSIIDGKEVLKPFSQIPSKENGVVIEGDRVKLREESLQKKRLEKDRLIYSKLNQRMLWVDW